ncbi:pleckstrin homology domain-containing family G member 4B-like [Brachionichthys hirsutus]|uniref:pleckstrin homology domain-containing family G member 4B-like n=1 Tax=Brachionichthys hirsutus TaxID=412623 RepID=UPI00360541E5
MKKQPKGGAPPPLERAAWNPDSLDSSIQSTLSALFPPFEATAPVVLGQLFRSIEERYHGDALQCLLDFLIPSKHLLESVQQAACAGYSDVLFRCEGWPLCLRDKTVIQLAPVNPLLLRPGDFYLQVEPFGDQAARIVLKSLLVEDCREVEETPVPETSYPCIFTEEWLQDINEGRQGTPLSRCLLCTDQGVIKLPWAKIAIPEFLDKPKILTNVHEAPPEAKHISVPSHFSSSTLPVEAIFLPSKDRMSASLRPLDCSSKLVKLKHERRTSKSCSKPLVRPVGWVSPNTWDSQDAYQESEGDYVDLVDIYKGKHGGSRVNPANSGLCQPARPAPPTLCGGGAPCGCTLQYVEKPCAPCSQRRMGHEPDDPDSKGRYRESYVAALRNPVPFERGGVDLLAALGDVGLCEAEELSSKGASRPNRNRCSHCNKPSMSDEPWQCCRPTPGSRQPHPKDHPTSFELENLMKEPPVVLKSTPGLSHSQKIQMKLISHQPGASPGVPAGSDSSLENCDGDIKPDAMAEDVKPSGKHKAKVRSLSSVSETSKGSPPLYKLNNRSYSDICPETITDMMQCERSELSDQATRRLERRKSPKNGFLTSSGDAAAGATTEEPGSKLQISRTEKPSTCSDTRESPEAKESSFRSISALIELGMICLPGSRDRTGRPVVEVHTDRKEWASPLVSAQSVCDLLLYLHSIPRKDIRELGMTLVINARRKPPSLHLYKALLMAQVKATGLHAHEQALHAVHSVVMLVDKDTCPRPEKQPGLQMDVVTSMKALSKTVEASQLTSDLGGAFAYSHSDWLQFHQRLVSFMADLRGADRLLQKAIKKVDDCRKMDTGQEVQQCIQDQRASMKEVLQDARLVSLQREGGAVLARMKKEDFRFPHSEDYRDALESATSLYNQLDEKLHTLVMRSNESLQHLELLFTLRETEAKINTAGMWFSTEGEQRLNDPRATDETLESTEETLQNFDVFLKRAKENQQHALSIAKEAEGMFGRGVSNPAADVFQTLLSTFKGNLDDFMLRAEEKYKDLDAKVQMHRFCEQASSTVKECSRFLEKVEQGCDSASTLSTLQMFQDRLGDEFATQNFQALKTKVCAMRSGAPGVMGVWNAAWVQCQEIRQRLETMQKKKTKTKGSDKNQILQTVADPQGDGIEEEEERGDVGKSECPPTQKQATAPRSNNHLRRSKKGEPQTQNRIEAAAANDKTTRVLTPNINRHPESKSRPREHHSEADLRSTASGDGGSDFPFQQPLGRSLSEGSCSSCRLTAVSWFSPLNVRNKHCQSRTQQPEQHLQPTQHPCVPQNQCLVSGVRDGEQREGRTASTQRPQDLRTAETLLTPAQNNGSNALKLRRIMEELLATEREYVKALGYVREQYLPELERADVPQDLRGQGGSIFGNLERLHDFHRLRFTDELEGCMSEPLRVGRCFLRHREGFALYALYSKNKPRSDSLLINHGQVFFKQKQLRLGDKMDLWSYLLKPVQRISKYSLLLQDMMRECGAGQSREMAEVKAALEVIQFQLRHGNNLLAMDAIHHCDVNLKEQGQLIRQDEFLVTFRKRKCFRHIFLFQELVLFGKTRETDVGNDTYIYKQSFKTSDIGLTQNTGESGLCFEIWFRKRKTHDTYTLKAANREVKHAWTKDLERILWEQAVNNRAVRMQERVFMGIGNKPFMDIKPSDAAISDRAIDYVLMGREHKALSSVGSRGSQDGLPAARPKSAGSGSSSSSSSSSGRGSLPPVGYLCGSMQTMGAGGIVGYTSPPGAPEEDDLDHESGSQNLLLDSSESSGDSVSGFSSSSHSFHSAIGGEVEDTPSVFASAIVVKDAAIAYRAEASAGIQENDLPASPAAAKPDGRHATAPSCCKVQESTAGKSTEV